MTLEMGECNLRKQHGANYPGKGDQVSWGVFGYTAKSLHSIDGTGARTLKDFWSVQ